MPDLSRRAAELTDQVEKLRLAVEHLDERTKRAERATARTGVAAAVLLVLILLGGWNVHSQRQTADRLESVTQRSLCPVFGLVIGGYEPESRPAGPARDRYVETIDVMRGAYGELGCVAPLVPPRTTG